MDVRLPGTLIRDGASKERPDCFDCVGCRSFAHVFIPPPSRANSQLRISKASDLTGHQVAHHDVCDEWLGYKRAAAAVCGIQKHSIIFSRKASDHKFQ